MCVRDFVRDFTLHKVPQLSALSNRTASCKGSFWLVVTQCLSLAFVFAKKCASLSDNDLFILGESKRLLNRTSVSYRITTSHCTTSGRMLLAVQHQNSKARHLMMLDGKHLETPSDSKFNDQLLCSSCGCSIEDNRSSSLYSEVEVFQSAVGTLTQTGLRGENAERCAKKGIAKVLEVANAVASVCAT
eukprot:IDg3107t1